MAANTRAGRTSVSSDDLLAVMAKANVAPLWEAFEAIVVPEPNPPAPGTHWRWKDLLPIIQRSGTEVSNSHYGRFIFLFSRCPKR